MSMDTETLERLAALVQRELECSGKDKFPEILEKIREKLISEEKIDPDTPIEALLGFPKEITTEH